MLTISDIEQALKAAGVELEVDLETNKSASFEEIGIDSLDIFNLFLELEAITGQAIPDDKVDNLLTISDILNYHNHQ
jgi:acyl carrier protein